jgi:hypothetical protein
MDTHVVLHPHVGVNPKQFATHWNADPECRKHGVARIAKPETKQYALETIAVIIGSIALSLATNALYDVIKSLVMKLIAKKDAPLSIREQTKSDGTRVYLVFLDSPDQDTN